MSNIAKEGSKIYELDPDGVNKWSFLVQPGYGLDGHWQPQSVVDKVVNKMAAVDDLYRALESIASRLQMDIDDGSRPDQWTMESLVKTASSAMSKANGDTQ
jgi:hypothetical protein